MKAHKEAYLDIETTGLTPIYDDITVVGIYLCDGVERKVVQLVGREANADSIMDAMKGISVIYTYNGKSFDLPFIRSRLNLNLDAMFEHHDLMYDCWRKNLYGGFKSVERQLGIERRLKDVDGYEAIRLWWRYVDNSDTGALDTLLEYNKEDILNLRVLKELLPCLNR